MKKAVIIIVIVVVVFIVALVIFSGGDNATTENGGTTQKVQTAADFNKLANIELKDYEGNLVTLEDFRGKSLLVNAWATWCPFCVQELPDFASVQEEFGEDIVIIAIDRAESIESAKRFSDDLGVTDVLTMLVDSGDNFYRSIGGFSMPETIFVNVDGEVVDHKRGPMSVSEIKDRTNKAFGLLANQ